MEDYVANERMPDINFHKIPRYSIALEGLKVWLLFAGAGMFMVYASYYQAGGYSEVWYPLVAIMFMPFISTWIRRKVRNLPIFLITHIAMASYILLAKDDISKFLMILYVLFLTIYGMVRSGSQKPERDLSMMALWSTILVMLIIYVFSIALGTTRYETSMMLQGFVYTVVYLYYDHQVAVVDALKAMDRQGTMPTRRVRAFNRNVFLGYMVFAILLLMGSYFAGMGNLLNMLGRNLLRLIRAIVGYFSKGETTITVEDPVGEILQDTAEDDMVGFGTPETAMFWVILQKILTVAFILLMIYIIVMLLIRLFKSFQSTRSYHEGDYDEVTTRIQKIKPEREKKQRLSIFDRSPENLIRRAYFKKVRKKMDKEVSRSDTPTEVAAKLPDVEEIVVNYEKVRYGNGLGE